MAQSKRITTRAVVKWQRLERFTFAIPLVAFIILSLVPFFGGTLWTAVFDDFSFPAFIAAFVIVAITATILSLPFMLLWYALSHTIKTNALRNTKFTVEQSIDYYREKLTHLAPTDISLLADLGIETKKDIAASVLKYKLLGVVSTEGECVNVLSFDHPDLSESDRTLLNLFAQGHLDPRGLGMWQTQAIQESIQKGYVAYKPFKAGNVAKPIAKSVLGGCLLPLILFFVVLPLVSSTTFVLYNLESIEAYLLSLPPDTANAELLGYIFANPEFIITACWLLVFALVVVVIILAPLLVVIWLIASLVGQRPVRRTAQGEVLAEQVRGMKNFIHDFTNLSQAEKEALIVWDEFLIYAVALEENEGVVQEIFSLRNISYGLFRTLRH